MWNDGMFAGGAMMWFFWIGLAVLLWLVLKGVTGSGERVDEDARLSPLELLDKRLARGEISPEEYQRLRRTLLEQNDPPSS